MISSRLNEQDRQNITGTLMLEAARDVEDAIRHGLAVSGTGLRWSLTMIVIGLCFVAPWAVLVWALVRLISPPGEKACH